MIGQFFKRAFYGLGFGIGIGISQSDLIATESNKVINALLGKTKVSDKGKDHS
jgi:hypothetical protein